MAKARNAGLKTRDDETICMDPVPDAPCGVQENTIGHPATAQPETIPSPPVVTATPEPRTADPDLVRVELPLGTIDPKAYLSKRCDLSNLSPRQARALRQLTEGLQDAAARLENGRRVTSSADAVRYVLEKLC